MKDYQFVYPYNYGEEKFYFEDGQENVVVISAENGNEAKEKLLKMVDGDYEEEAESCAAVEINWDGRWNGHHYPHYFSYWKIEDSEYIYGEPQKRE